MTALPQLDFCSTDEKLLQLIHIWAEEWATLHLSPINLGTHPSKSSLGLPLWISSVDTSPKIIDAFAERHITHERIHMTACIRMYLDLGDMAKNTNAVKLQKETYAQRECTKHHTIYSQYPKQPYLRQ